MGARCCRQEPVAGCILQPMHIQGGRYCGEHVVLPGAMVCAARSLVFCFLPRCQWHIDRDAVASSASAFVVAIPCTVGTMHGPATGQHCDRIDRGDNSNALKPCRYLYLSHGILVTASGLILCAHGISKVIQQLHALCIHVTPHAMSPIVVNATPDIASR
jgi:hypothetical protein